MGGPPWEGWTKTSFQRAGCAAREALSDPFDRKVMALWPRHPAIGRQQAPEIGGRGEVK